MAARQFVDFLILLSLASIARIFAGWVTIARPFLLCWGQRKAVSGGVRRGAEGQDSEEVFGVPDWEALKIEYVTTKTSYRKLSAKHAIPLKNLQDRASKEKWVDEKRKFRKNVVEKAIKKIENQQAGQLAKLQKAASDLSVIVAEAAADERIFLANGEYSHKALQSTVRSLKDLTEVIRDLYDLPGMRQREAQRLAQERLELERERVELEKTKMGDNNVDGGGVIEIGAVLPEEDAAETEERT